MPRGNLTVALALLIATAVTTAAAQHDPFPDGAGKDELLGVCRDCHGPDIVLVTRKTRDEWARVLRDMAALGVQGSPDEFQGIGRYLDRHFAVVKVNAAEADELEATLGITTEVADAIVTYRGAKGGFVSIDDLKRVPGLPPETIDASRDRLVFEPAKGGGRPE